jgi:ATP-dependent Clp protease adaptor protein ClpS
MASRRREQENVQTRDRVEKPRRFKVLLFNDDYTTMEFVTFVLEEVFHHSPAEATRIMLAIHKSGVGVAGVYTREAAETRVDQVLRLAEEAGHPLQCGMEPE